MSKFRSRQLDATKPIPIFFQEDISDSTEFNNVTNRSVPQLPTGMEKEEETEHHLQQAIFHHRVIPVPEVYDIGLINNAKIPYDRLYPPSYKAPRQLIHIHPFSTDQDIPDYDLDSEDEEWLEEHARKGELLPLVASQFEEMMDRLEKASGLKAVTLQEAKLLLKDDDDLITTVYDYWLNKRLTLQHPLIPQQVKSEKGTGGSTTDPYVAFRKRTEKMQTRKNRKNDESSYEKMLKLRRDLARALTLLEMIKRREKSKREYLHLNIEIHEKRNEVEDYSGSILNELTSQKLIQSFRPAFAPIIPNHQLSSGLSEYDETEGESLGNNNSWLKVPPLSRPKGKKRDEGRRERRPYKKKKRNQHIVGISSVSGPNLSRSYTHPPDPYSISSVYSQVGSNCSGAADDDVASTSLSEAEDEASLDGYYAFRRNALISYLPPQDLPIFGDESPAQQYSLTTLSHDNFIGLSRRRVGRGGRILLDRIRHPSSEIKIKNEVKDSGSFGRKASDNYSSIVKKELLHFHPSSAVSLDTSEDSEDTEVDVETVCGVSSLVPSSPVLNEGPAGDKKGGIGESSIPSTFYITAEVVDGSNEGALTQLQVTLPSPEEMEFFPGSDSGGGNSILLEENNLEEMDFLPTNTGRSGSVCGSSKINDCVSTQSDSLTSGNSVISSHFQSDSPYRDKESKSSVSSCSKWPSGSSKKSSVTFNSSHQHSIFDFQTQPSSKFSTLDTNVISNTQSVSRQLSHSSSSGDELQKLGISPLTNCSPSNSWQPLCNSSSSSSFVKNTSDISSSSLSSQTSVTLISSSVSSSFTTSSSPLLSKTISVSSSLATSLNSLLCASQNLSVKKNCENSNSQELNTKKLMNLSSIYIRQPKDSLQLESKQLPSGFLLSNNRNNGNNVLSNSSSNLVSHKILSSWTNEALSMDDSSPTVLTNGPGTKTLDNLKCTKVAPILFHET